MRRPRTLLAVIGVAVALAACGDSTEGEEAGTGLPAQDADLVAAGEPLYGAFCAECHGVDLRGTDKGPSHLSVVYEPSHHGDGAFLLATTRGVRQHHWRFGDMPAIPELSLDDITAITAFVRENQRTYGFEPYPP